jgi:hypothetical protein
LSWQEIYECLDYIKNCEDLKEIIQELIDSDYRFDEILDF